jgi:Fe-S-cluster-containing dehydrogenase component
MIGDPHVADSCDFCAERIDSGQLPYCVESCPMDALVFGDLDEPKSEVRKLIDLKNAQPLNQKFKTKPKVFYANFEEYAYMGTKLFA